MVSSRAGALKRRRALGMEVSVQLPCVFLRSLKPSRQINLLLSIDRFLSVGSERKGAEIAVVEEDAVIVSDFFDGETNFPWVSWRWQFSLVNSGILQAESMVLLTSVIADANMCATIEITTRSSA